MTRKNTNPPASSPVAVSFPAWETQAGAMVRGLEAIRKVNDRAVQKALLRYTLAAKTLSAPRQPMDLFAMPSELIRSEFEGTASYWQELSGAALEMQAELLGCSGHLVDSDALLQVASAMKSLPAFNGLAGFLRSSRPS